MATSIVYYARKGEKREKIAHKDIKTAVMIVNKCFLVLQDIATNSLVEDDATSEASVANLSRFIPRMPTPSPTSHIVSIGQLMESVISLTPGLRP